MEALINLCIQPLRLRLTNEEGKLVSPIWDHFLLMQPLSHHDAFLLINTCFSPILLKKLILIQLYFYLQLQFKLNSLLIIFIVINSPIIKAFIFLFPQSLLLIRHLLYSQASVHFYKNQQYFGED